MFKNLIGEKVSVIISSRSDNLLEYDGVLVNETDDILELKDTSISYLMLNFHKGIFGGNMSIYKENLDKVYIAKKYVISCNK